MAEFKLGRIRFVWKGDWVTGNTYYKDDVVAFGGKIYICVIGHSSADDFFTDLDIVPSKWNLVSDGQTWKGDWGPQVEYFVGDLARYGGRIYICAARHTSAVDSTTGLEADLANWQIFAEGLDWKGSWTPGFDYKINDVVNYGGSTYVCVDPHIADNEDLGLENAGIFSDTNPEGKWELFNKGFDYKGTWTDDLRYKLNDVVRYGAGLYVSLTGHNSTTNFPTDLANGNWEKLVDGFQYEEEWKFASVYQPGDIVRFGGYQYIATQTVTNVRPGPHAGSITNLSLVDPLVVTSTDHNLSNGKAIGITGVEGTTQLNNNTYYVGNVTADTFSLYTDPELTASVDGAAFSAYTSGGTWKNTGTAEWDQFSKGINFLGEWGEDSTAYDYRVGDTVSVGGYTYTCISSHQSQQPPNPVYWSLFNTGINWKGDWLDDQEYSLGDIVLLGSNAYICILGHISEGDDGSSLGGAIDSRPDLDTTGTYWNIFAIGSETSTLTTKGDLVYYSGSGPARLPIGKDGQILQVSAEGLPEWAFKDSVADVYYVAEHGVDSPAPIYGKSIDRPFRSVNYAARQIEKGAKNPEAAKLLELNRRFIQREIVEWTNYQITNNTAPFTTSFDYDTKKCERDMGLIVDAIIWDITHGGNQRSVEAALKYVNEASRFYTLGQEAETVASIEYGLTVIDDVLNQIAPDSNYQTLNGDNSTAIVDQYVDLSLEAETVYTDIVSLVTVITDAITAGVATNIPTKIIPNTLIKVSTGTYYENLPIIIPAECCVIGDELRSSNVVARSADNSTLTPKDDFKYSFRALERVEQVIGNIVTGTTVTATTGNTELQDQTWPFADSGNTSPAVEKLARTIRREIDYKLGTKAEANLLPVYDFSTRSAGNFRELVLANKDFLAAEVTAYVDDNYLDIFYSRTKCKRDVGYIIDALAYDASYGGNWQSVIAGESYYNGAGGILQIDSTEKAATLAAYAHLKSKISDVGQNIATSVTTGNSVSQVLGLGGQSSDATVYDNNIDDIITIVDTGVGTVTITYPTLSANGQTAQADLNSAKATIASNVTTFVNTNFPTLIYDEAKCERDVGLIIDAAIYDADLGTNFASITAAHAYLRSYSNDVLGDQKAASIAGFEYAKTLAVAEVPVGADYDYVRTGLNTTFEWVNDTIFYGSAEGANSQVEEVDVYDAVRMLELNKEFIVQEAINFVDDYFKDTVTGITVPDANALNIASTAWLYQGMPVIFKDVVGATNTVAEAGITADTTYYVREIVSATEFTIAATVDGVEISLPTDVNGFTVEKAYVYNVEICARDLKEYIDAIKWDLVWPQEWERTYTNSVTLYLPAAYKTKLAARYYANSVLGCKEEDFYYVRNNTGVRNQTLNGLNGDLGPRNTFGTSRPTAGAYVSLDPGWGPNDERVWISSRSPYVQNCSTFGYAATGQRIDGALHNGGNDSIVSNDFTQVISDGIGAHILNNGRAELVSVFTYYSHIGYLAESGGRIRATNGNNSYGDFGSVAEGVDPDETVIQAVVDNRLQFEATVSEVFTNQNQVLQLEFLHAGDEYTEAEMDIFGVGIGEEVYTDEFRDGGVNNVILTETEENAAGGSNYTISQNVAQNGTTSDITIAATDGSASNAYPGMMIYCISGAASGQYGIIGSYDAASKTADVYKIPEQLPALASTMSSGNFYIIESLGDTNWAAIAGITIGDSLLSATPTVGDIFKATGAGSGTGTVKLLDAGWDHVVDGTTITSPNSTTTYNIEPRVYFESPDLPSVIYNNSSALASDDFLQLHYFETTDLYTNVAAANGSGSNATFNIRRNGSKYYLGVSNAGTGYERLDQLTILGTDIGGASPANDIIIEPTAVNLVTGAIIDFDFNGYGEKGLFVTLPTGGGTASQYSADGKTWSNNALPSSGVGTWCNAATGLIDDGSSTDKPSAMVVVSDGSDSIAYSTDGISWAATTHDSAMPSTGFKSIAFGTVGIADNRFILINATSTTVLNSADGGATWATVGTLPSTGYEAITYGAGRFVAIGSTSSTVAISDDGSIWTTGTLPSTGYDQIVWGNGKYVALSTSGSKVAYSLDATTWSELALPAGPTYNQIAYGQGAFVISNSTNALYFSSNAREWNSVNISVANTDAIAFGNSEREAKFVAIPDATTTAVQHFAVPQSAKGRSSVSNQQVFEIRITDPGVEYSSVPDVIVFDPNNVRDVLLTARLGVGIIAQPSWKTRGQGFTSASAELNEDKSNGYANFLQTGSFVAVRQLSEVPVPGSNVSFTDIPGQFFKLVAVVSRLGSNDGSYTAFLQLSPEVSLNDAPADATDVTLQIRYSQVRLTGHDFLDIGTGNQTKTNYPGLPTVPADQLKETTESNGGRVFFTTTDQDGNFRVGDLFSIEQSTGVATLNADAFNIAGLQELTLGEVTLGGNSASITEFSTDPFFTANSDSIIPTQRAIKAYIESQIGGGGASLIVNSITAGDIFISTNTISTVSGEQINITGNVNFSGSILGLPLAYNYFLR